MLVQVFQVHESQPDAAGDSSFHFHCNKKRSQSMEFLLDQPATAKTVLIALLSTEPVDHLSARLQHLDAHGSVLRYMRLLGFALRVAFWILTQELTAARFFNHNLEHKFRFSLTKARPWLKSSTGQVLCSSAPSICTRC